MISTLNLTPLSSNSSLLLHTLQTARPIPPPHSLPACSYCIIPPTPVLTQTLSRLLGTPLLFTGLCLQCHPFPSLIPATNRLPKILDCMESKLPDPHLLVSTRLSESCLHFTLFILFHQLGMTFLSYQNPTQAFKNCLKALSWKSFPIPELL